VTRGTATSYPPYSPVQERDSEVRQLRACFRRSWSLNILHKCAHQQLVQTSHLALEECRDTLTIHLGVYGDLDNINRDLIPLHAPQHLQVTMRTGIA
jgi:hypothetical protein